MSNFSDAKIKAVAEYSWWRRTSKSWRETSKREKELAAEHNLTEDQIRDLQFTYEYHKHVEQLMVGQQSSKKFERWIRKDGVQKRFAEHMGIDQSLIPRMINRVRQAHCDIASGKMKAPPEIPNPKK